MTKSNSKRRYFSPEFKRNAVAQVEQSDQPLAAIARTLGITPSMLGRWKQELAAGSGGLSWSGAAERRACAAACSAGAGAAP